jgi:hypothetical protein
MLCRMPEYKAMDVLNEITGSDMSAVRRFASTCTGAQTMLALPCLASF